MKLRFFFAFVLLASMCMSVFAGGYGGGGGGGGGYGGGGGKGGGGKFSIYYFKQIPNFDSNYSD